MACHLGARETKNTEQEMNTQLHPVAFKSIPLRDPSKTRLASKKKHMLSTWPSGNSHIT